MKKVLALILILGMASMASAAVSFQVAADDAMPDNEYAFNAQITIEVVAENDVAGVNIPFITATGGAASDPALAAGMVNMPWDSDGTVVNADGVLIKGVSGGVSLGDDPKGAGTALLSFEYIVPDVEGVYVIDNADDPPMFNFTTITLATTETVNDIGELAITAIPEPLTMTLLGLGGLALLRRRRA